MILRHDWIIMLCVCADDIMLIFIPCDVRSNFLVPNVLMRVEASLLRGDVVFLKSDRVVK